MAIIILCLWSPSPKHRHDHHRHRRDTLISIVASLLSRQLLLLRLSLPLSDKVKHYSAIALHTIKRQPYGSCQLPITRLQNMIISYNKIQHHALTISHHNMPLQKQVRRPLLCCCKFLRGCYGLKQEPILPTHQNHNDSLSNRLRFNLRKDRA